MDDYEKLSNAIDRTLTQTRSLRRQRLLLLVLAGMAFLMPSPLRAAPTTDAITAFTVNRVYDGDTFFINLPRTGCYYDVLCRDLAVRVVGVDTPELRGAKCPQEKLAAVKARDFVIKVLRAASSIALVDVKRDGRFRIDATVLLNGQHDLADIIIRAHHGVPYLGTAARAQDWCGGAVEPSSQRRTPHPSVRQWL